MPEGKIIKALSGFYYVLSETELFNVEEEGFFGKIK